jgi:DNA-binding NtrC family response regulator
MTADIRATANPQEGQETSSSERLRILLVDDSPLLCEGVKRAFRSLGVDCITTNKGVEALRLVRTEPFDMVFTDLMMPSMSGEKIVQHVNHIVPDMPVVIMTGNATKDAVVRMSRMPNVAGFIIKPWDVPRLQKAIGKAQAKRQALQVPTKA